MVPLITEPALEDLNAIWDDLDRIDRAYANRTIRTLVEHILRLGEFPEAYPLVPSISGQAIRRMNVAVWAVFYSIDRGRPTVVRVVSGRRDLGPLLAEIKLPPTT